MFLGYTDRSSKKAYYAFFEYQDISNDECYSSTLLTSSVTTKVIRGKIPINVRYHQEGTFRISPGGE